MTNNRFWLPWAGRQSFGNRHVVHLLARRNLAEIFFMIDGETFWMTVASPFHVKEMAHCFHNVNIKLNQAIFR
jgi:hypothetical protein